VLSWSSPSYHLKADPSVPIVDSLLREWKAGRVEPLPVRLSDADLDAKARAV
jgi:hypothetical protein